MNLEFLYPDRAQENGIPENDILEEFSVPV